MARDSLFNESILWAGRPKVLSTPLGFRITAAIAAVAALVAMAFALVVATSLHARVGGLVLFAAWCSTVALGAWRAPLLWQSEVEYIITEKHVIWRRGRLRRSIERAAISYAHIRWSADHQAVGDLVLVRAVPTGALRRTLRLTMAGVTGPDRLWAIVRGITPSAPLGDGDLPLAQRLDEGERVLWSGAPLESRWTARRAATAMVAGLLSLAAVRVVLTSARPLRRLLRMHALPLASSAVLIGAVVLAVLVLVVLSGGVAYLSCIRPGRLLRNTRYLVTDRRVLIRRGHEELHLDRARITYVIAAPVHGLHDLFLVLDGPQARGLAASGAFQDGSADEGLLRPVFSAIEDADTVGMILRGGRPAALPNAA